MTFMVAATTTVLSCGDGASTSSPTEDQPPKYDAQGCFTSDNVQPGQVCVRTLAARVMGLGGEPVPNLTATACGDGCSYGRTDGSGVLRMDVRRYMSKAALMLHGRSRWASYYSRFDAAGDIDKGQLYLPQMPFAEGIDLPQDGAAKVVTFGDVGIAIGASAKVEIDRIELETPEEIRFRAVAVPIEKAPPFVAEAGGGFATVYAMTPFGTKIDPPAKVTLANTAQLPAGAAVELFIQGTELDDKYGTFGRFTRIADGHVSADGATIATDQGQGIPQITWLGVRLKK
jgi:hypothetical protein